MQKHFLLNLSNSEIDYTLWIKKCQKSPKSLLLSWAAPFLAASACFVRATLSLEKTTLLPLFSSFLSIFYCTF